MVMIQPNAATEAFKTLQIESTQLLPNVLPTIAIGDIIRVTVRQNPQEGLGLIYFKGLLVKAALPQNVVPGDKLLAKITESNNNVVLKILERDPAPEAGGVAQVSLQAKELISDLHELAEQVGASQFRALNSVQIKDVLQQGAVLQKTVQNLLKVIPEPEQLVDAQPLFEQLQNAADGGLAPKFRAIATELRTLVEKHGPPPVHKELVELRRRLEEVFTQAADNNFEAAEDIFRLTTMLSDGLKERTRLPLLGPEKDATKALVDKMRVILKQSDTLDRTQVDRSEIQVVLNQATALIGSIEKRLGVEPRSAEDLVRLAARFEQMAQTQETLARLNPVMQALGEPALLLFPFLVQGLVSHSEVTIETKKRVRSDDDQDSTKREQSEPYHRIQVTVPLPNMGTIDVDIAHRTAEILVRFTSDNAEIGQFLLEQLEHLAGTLRDLGFHRADLVSHVGAHQEQLPAWSFGLHAGRSIVA